MVRVGILPRAHVLHVSLAAIQREIPILQPVLGCVSTHRIHIRLIIFGIGDVRTGQRRREQHQTDPLLPAELGDAGQVGPAEIRKGAFRVHIQQGGKTIPGDALCIDEAVAAVSLPLLRVGHTGIVVQIITAGEFGAPERRQVLQGRRSMAGRKHQIRKGCQTTHLPQIAVTPGGIPAHMVGQQITGQRHVAGGALVIPGIKHFQIHRLQRVLFRRLPQHIIGTVRELLGGPGIETVGPQRLIHGFRVHAAVAVGGPQEQRVDLPCLCIQFLQHDAGIGVHVVHEQKVCRAQKERRE